MRAPCNFCGGEFASNAALSSHVRHKHPFAKVTSFLSSVTQPSNNEEDVLNLDDNILNLDDETEPSEEDLTELKAMASTSMVHLPFLSLIPKAKLNNSIHFSSTCNPHTVARSLELKTPSIWVIE
jgi:hypothetical protein